MDITKPLLIGGLAVTIALSLPASKEEDPKKIDYRPIDISYCDKNNLNCETKGKIYPNGDIVGLSRDELIVFFDEINKTGIKTGEVNGNILQAIYFERFNSLNSK